MAITQAMCSTFKGEVMQALHDFDVGANVFKLALYTSSATLGASTTAYSATNEVANSGDYVAGGGTLTNQGVTVSGTTGFTDFDNLSFTNASITGLPASFRTTIKALIPMDTFLPVNLF